MSTLGSTPKIAQNKIRSTCQATVSIYILPYLTPFFTISHSTLPHTQRNYIYNHDLQPTVSARNFSLIGYPCLHPTYMKPTSDLRHMVADLFHQKGKFAKSIRVEIIFAGLQ